MTHPGVVNLGQGHPRPTPREAENLGLRLLAALPLRPRMEQDASHAAQGRPRERRERRDT